jgi:hypothetical protein
MRVRSLVCGSILVAAGTFGCSSPDPGGYYSLANGGGADAGGGNGNGNGSSSGGGGNPGSGGSDASTGGPGPVNGDSGPGSTGAADAASDAGSTNDAGLTSTADAAPSDGFDQFQHRNLDDINKYRATLGVAPLVLDQQLCTFAVAGSLELSQDHLPHQHFINAGNNGTLWTSGFNTTAAENQGDPNGWTKLDTDPTQNELDQIDAIQLAMFDEGPGTGDAHGHYTNMMDATSTRLGVGLLEVNGMLYLTNDFSQ